MLFRKKLESLARQVAKDLRAVRRTLRSRKAMDFMAANPSAVVGAIDLIRQQAGRELHRRRRLAEVPVLRTIAERTVDMWEEW